VQNPNQVASHLIYWLAGTTRLLNMLKVGTRQLKMNEQALHAAPRYQQDPLSLGQDPLALPKNARVVAHG
jgi:hypothetical protein